MKLHLPYKLRHTLMACICSVAALGSTLTTATLSVGTLVAALSSQAWAATSDPEDPDTYLTSFTSDNQANAGETYNLSVMNDGEGYTAKVFLMTTGATDDYHGLYVAADDTVTVTTINHWCANANTHASDLDKVGYTKLGAGILVISSAPEGAAAEFYAPTNVTVGAGTLQVKYGSSSGFVAGAASVEAGATLQLSHSNALGWGDNAVKTLTLTGAENNLATLTLDAGANQTLKTNLVLEGYTTINSATLTATEDTAYIKAFGGTITANNSNNTINAWIRSDADNDSKALTLDGTGSLTIAKMTNAQGLTVEVDTTVTTYTTDSTGSIRVADNKSFTISNVKDYQYDTWNTDNTAHKNLQALFQAAVTEKGYAGEVVLADQVSASGKLTDDAARLIEVQGNYRLEGGLLLSSYANVDGGTGELSPMEMRVLTGGSLIAEVKSTGALQDLKFLRSQTLTVDGGTVKAGAITLGHSNEGNSSKDYHSDLYLKSGSITANTISLQHKNSDASIYSTFEMTGGTLEFLQSSSSAITKADADSIINLEGGTLKATSSSWFVSADVALGGGENGLTIETKDDYTISFTGTTTFNGTIINKGALELSGTLKVTDLLALQAKDLTYKGAGDDTANGYSSGGHWLVKAGETEDGSTPSLTTKLTTVNVAGTDKTLTVDKGNAYFEYSDNTAYYVNTEVDYTTASSSVVAANGQHFALNGGTLNVDAGEELSQNVVVIANNSVIYGGKGDGAESANVHGGITGSITHAGEGGDLIIQTNAATASNTGHGDFFSLNASVDLGAHSLIIRGGVVRLGNKNQGMIDDTSSITATNVVVEEGATFELFRKIGTMNSGIKLQGGTINMQLVNGAGSLSFGALTVENGTTATSTLTGNAYDNGVLAFSSLTGTGNLNITGADTTFATVTDYTGALAVSGGNTVFNGGVFGGTVSISGGTVTMNGTQFNNAVTLSGGTLVSTGSGFSTTQAISVTGNSVLKLDGTGVTQNASDVSISAGTLTLKGTGTYQIGSSQLSQTNVSYADSAWTGTVKFDSVSFAGQNLASYSNDNSSILLRGTTGYFVKDSKVTADIILENTSLAALEIQNGYAGGTLEFAGSVSNASNGGNFVRAWSSSTDIESVSNEGKLSYIFSGDVSGWTNGHIRVTSDVKNSATDPGHNATYVTFKGGATDINMGLKTDSNDTAALLVTVENDKDVTVDSAIQNNVHMTYKGTGKKTVTSANSNYTGTTTVEAGSVVVKNNAKLGSGDVTLKGGSLMMENSDNTTAATFSKKTGATDDAVLSGVSLTGSAVSDNASITGTGSISHAAVVVDKGYSFSGVSISDCSFDVKAALQMNSSTTLDADTTVTISSQGSLYSDGTLALSGTGHSLALGVAGTGTATVESDGATLTLTKLVSNQLYGLASGSDATFALSLGKTLAELAGADVDGVVIVFTSPTNQAGLDLQNTTGNAAAASATTFTSTSGLTFTLESAALAGYTFDSALSNSLASQGQTVLAFKKEDSSSPEAIPEPTTATLSLLALAALAVRRRRR